MDENTTGRNEKRAAVMGFLNAETVMDTAKLHGNALANVHKSRNFGGGHVNQEHLIALLMDFGLDAVEGKLANYEYMLGCQIASLNAIFVDMMVKMANSDDLAAIEGFARIALKAQDNTRKTILSLHEMKTPKSATFIKQQTNQSLGHMQVNNSDNSNQLEKTEKLQKTKNELLEQQKNGERLDFRTAQETGGTDPVMAALGQFDRP